MFLYARYMGSAAHGDQKAHRLPAWHVVVTPGFQLKPLGAEIRLRAERQQRARRADYARGFEYCVISYQNQEQAGDVGSLASPLHRYGVGLPKDGRH